MPDHFISREQAEGDLLACAAFIGERIKSSEGHAEAMNEIVPRYLARGDVDLAAELANAVDDPFSRDRLLILVAEKCAEGDDDEYALQLADAIEDHALRAQALERIALAKAAKGQIAKALEIADSMAHPDFVYAGVAVNQAASGDESAAMVTIERIEYPTARVSAFQQIASAHLENGKAVEYLDLAAAAAGEIEHDEEKIRALCDTGNLYIDAKRNDKAVEIFEKARASAEVLDNQHQDYFLVMCALGFLNAGSDELADRTLDLVTDKTQMASALLGFARDDWKKGEKDAAVETLEEAYEILRSQRDSETRDSRTRNTLMSSIAAQFAGFGKTERAIEIAQGNKDPNEQTAALSQIAQILTFQHEDDLARQTVNLIAEDADRLAAFAAMSDVKNKEGAATESLQLLDEAFELAETVPQLSARTAVLSGIAERYIAHGETEQARSASLENLAVIGDLRSDTSQALGLARLSDVYTVGKVELSDAENEVIKPLVHHFEWL